MKTRRLNVRSTTWGKGALCVILCAALSLPNGCGVNPFLGLQDYQRDLLFFGALAAALLRDNGLVAGAVDTASPPPGTDTPAGSPVPGADGLNCWDLNGNGVGDADEDLNADGVFNALDCRGADGASGASGSAGVQGASGAAGPQGPIGPVGPSGSAGPAGPSGGAGSPGAPGLQGPPGPELFDMFVDNFFGDADGALPVVLIPIVEPILGTRPFDPASGFSPALAYRMAIPQTYDAGNDVTMRLFFFRTGPFDGDCLIFSVDARRLRNGQPGPQCYGGDAGDNCAAGRRWITVTPPPTDGTVGTPVPNGLNSGVYLVVDLPINTAAGLNLPNDLVVSDFLAFELQTVQHDGGQYEILGVEFFESAAGTARTAGATIFFPDEEPVCGCGGEGPDCNENGQADHCDIERGISTDCNENGIPDECEPDCNGNGVQDECDIADGRSFDCDQNGIPDECAACPPLDLVFLMDTSGSMGDEAAALCDSIGAVVEELRRRGIEVNPEILTIAPNDPGDVPRCVGNFDQSVLARYGEPVPGNNGTCPSTLTAENNDQKDENWAPATAIVAAEKVWTPGAIRVIVPVSDEGPCLGDSCDDPGADRDAVTNAIAIARLHNVVVSPVAANGSDECVIGLCHALADGTGGKCFESDEPANDLAAGIEDIVVEICRSATDCNGNGIPDACEVCGPTAEVDCLPDCNANGVPDSCEIKSGDAEDCDGNGVPDQCDPDGDGNGVPDACEPPCVCHGDVEAVCDARDAAATSSAGIAVFYDAPVVDDRCGFQCVEVRETAGKLCRVECDRGSGSFFPMGETKVTCRSYILGDQASGGVLVDECSFTVTVVAAPVVCAGTFTGTYHSGDTDGAVQGQLLSDGTMVITLVGALGKTDVTMEGTVSECGSVSATNAEFGYELSGGLVSVQGCHASGTFSFGKGGTGEWTVTFDNGG